MFIDTALAALVYLLCVIQCFCYSFPIWSIGYENHPKIARLTYMILGVRMHDFVPGQAACLPYISLICHELTGNGFFQCQYKKDIHTTYSFLGASSASASASASATEGQGSRHGCRKITVLWDLECNCVYYCLRSVAPVQLVRVIAEVFLGILSLIHI